MSRDPSFCESSLNKAPVVSGHTPTPWTAFDNPNSNYGLEIVADVKVKAKRVVCRVSGPDRADNAALIVRAVNSHETLVKALEQIKDLSKPGQTVSVSSAVDLLCDIWNAASAALASAREVQP